MINQFITVQMLAKQIEFITGLSTYVMNQMPAVFKMDQIYVILPEETDIKYTPYFGSDARVDYSVEIVQVAHESSMNRQDVIIDDLHSSMRAGTTVLEKCIPRLNNLNMPNGTSIKEFDCSTSTWVTDTKIYSLFKITLELTTFVEY